MTILTKHAILIALDLNIGAGVGISTLIDKFESVTKSLSSLKEMAERTGASVENLSGLSTIAKIGGRDFDAVEASIQKMNKALHGSDDESKSTGHALAALGLTIKDLKQMDPVEAFMAIAKAQENFADSGGKSAAMMAILGQRNRRSAQIGADTRQRRYVQVVGARWSDGGCAPGRRTAFDRRAGQ